MSSWRNSNPLHQYHPYQQPQSMQQYSNGSFSNPTENGPRAKCDKVVFEAIAKAAEIVVGSRCWIDHIPPNLGQSSSSKRFNLLVPEIKGVRDILGRWEQSLHVPLRLDVHYQHPDSRRELLERWCLEYAPKPAAQNPSGFPLVDQSTEPIVQLRQVCKQIVIWLRSLYCWSRMLPAQALRRANTQNSAIGFSIYVVSTGNDDVSGLVSQQGFSVRSQPHAVWTPYGELGWRVFYAPKSAIEGLIPKNLPYSLPISTSDNNRRPSSQPIPMQPQQSHARTQQQQQQIQQQQQRAHQAQSFRPSRELHRRDSTPITTTAQSAPQSNDRLYHRSKSDVSGSQINQAMDDLEQPNQYNIQVQLESKNSRQSAQGMGAGPNSNPPTKNLSALSLAMMTLSDEDDTVHSSTVDNAEAIEKRRAALHHAPPQIPHSSPNVNKKSPLASAGEYGYAYNNHIPSMRSNSTPPATNTIYSPQTLPNSTPLGSTPPGYLLSGPTPPPNVNFSNLIPPRGAVTPPFNPHPMGLSGEPPSQPLSSAASSTVTSGYQHSLDSHRQKYHQQPAGNPAPSTSLDLLHSSPFQQPLFGGNFGSSMAGTDPFASHGYGEAPGFSSSAGSGIHPRLQSMDDVDEMPFAVDSLDEGADLSGSTSMAATAAAASSSSSSNMIMRSMIQPPKRLKLFESATSGNASFSTAQGGGIADQLAEFKSFGASLMATSQSVSGSGEVLQTS